MKKRNNIKTFKKIIVSIALIGVLSLHAMEREDSSTLASLYRRLANSLKHSLGLSSEQVSVQEHTIDIMKQLPPELQEQIVFELLNDEPEKALQNLRNASLVSTSYAAMLKSDRVKSKRVKQVRDAAIIQGRIQSIITQPGPNWKIISEMNTFGAKPLVQDFMKSSKNQQWLKDITKKHRPSIEIQTFEPLLFFSKSKFIPMDPLERIYQERIYPEDIW